MGKNQFFIEIFVCKFKDFLKNFESSLVFSPNAEKFAARFTNFF